jgi:starch synthase
VPVVRATGGLADSIVDSSPETIDLGTATGFRLQAFADWALRETVERALAIYRDRPETWLRIQQNGMRADWSWDRSAAAYEALYRQLT